MREDSQKNRTLRRLDAAQAHAILIDVQNFFLSQLTEIERSKIISGSRSLVSLMKFLKIPVLATLERPVELKGPLPDEIQSLFSGPDNVVLEKEFFDLTKHREIAQHLRESRRTQVIVCGSETDVCVLQSCLGLIDQGFEVFVIEDLLFTSSIDASSAIARLRQEGVVVLTYKTLFHELLQAIEGGSHRAKLNQSNGGFPDKLPDCIV